MRYTPEEADEDLMLYHSNLTEFSQIRYIEYESFLEDRFPVCGEGMVDNPGSCDPLIHTRATERSATGCSGVWLWKVLGAGGVEGVLERFWFMGTLLLHLDAENSPNE